MESLRRQIQSPLQLVSRSLGLGFYTNYFVFISEFRTLSVRGPEAPALVSHLRTLPSGHMWDALWLPGVEIGLEAMWTFPLLGNYFLSLPRRASCKGYQHSSDLLPSQTPET